MRLTVDEQEYQLINSLLVDNLDNEEVYKLKEKLNLQYIESTNISQKKRDATKNATKARTETSRIKIENTINLARLENKKLTIYSLAKLSGVSYNTAKKYKHLLEL